MGTIEAWVEAFGDPRLDALIAKALAANTDLETARSRVREARFEEISAGASFWPTVKANGAVERTRLSKNSISLGDLGSFPGASGAGAAPGAATAGFGLPGTDFNTFQLGFDASWQLDFFGQTRRTVEAADADTAAAIWTMRDTQVSVAAEVASTYLNMRFTEERVRIAKSDIARLKQTLHLLDVRATGGLASQLDVRQQETEVASTSAGLPPLEGQAETQLHALAVLLGEAPEGFKDDTVEGSALPVPRDIPAGLPSELLRRRPDIREAERRVAAASARIGVAVADFYPQFSLTASPTVSSSTLAKLLTLSSGGYSLGASLAWPLFNGGQTRAKINVATEKEQQALTAYRKSVLTALKEVEDALTQTAADRARQAELERSAVFAEGAERLAREQYEGGLVDFSRVISAEGMHLTADDNLAEIKAAIAQDWVALYKALGGGWRDEDLAQQTPAANKDSG